MMLGVWRGQVIRAAIDFDIFTKLQGRKLKAYQLAAECDMSTVRKPEEFFNVLVSVKLLEKNENGEYYLNRISEKYLSREQDMYYGYFFSHATTPSETLSSNVT